MGAGDRGRAARRGALVAWPCLFLLLGTTVAGAADPRPVASYRIQVRLDPETLLLHGAETLTWLNDASVPVGELWFHLYQNAFLNEASTKMRERGGFPGGPGPVAERLGYTDVHAIRLADGTDLLPTLRWRHPDDGNVDDRTVFSVELPRPVPPGGQVTVEIEFTTRLPRRMERSGIWDDYLIVTQWFPKVAVFEDAGERGRAEPGWNAHQFHLSGEFYADFGDYEVHITVPEGYVVGATGRRVRTETDPEAGTVTYVHEQADVHDFAWTAYPRFQEVVRTFDPAAEVSPEELAEVASLLGLRPEELRLRPVEVRLLIPPSFAHHAERHLRAAFEGLKWFGLWYGPYPYPTLTVVVPADGGTGGGMEYPTLFTAADAYPLRFWPLRELLAPEQVTVHEFGHQYWYGMVANNEFEEAWLDEGFNSYSTARVLTRAYGTAGGRLLGLPLGADAVARAMYAASPRSGRLVQPAWTYELGGYGVNAYPKSELVLRTLERHLGEATFARALRAYFQRWRLRHPGTADFIAVVEETCRCDLGPFWEQMVFGTAVADYAIARAETRPVRPPRGRFLREGEWVVVDPEAPADAVVAGVPLPEETAATEPPRLYRSRVVVQRREDLVWPVRVLLRFEDGSEILRSWDGRDRTLGIDHLGPSPLVAAVVDPGHRLPLDIDWLNNGWVLVEDVEGRRRWALRWLFWMAALLLGASGLA